MSRRTTTTDPDLRSHFGLRILPFTREISTSEQFTCETFSEALDDLTTAVAERQSACLVAPAGSGKTALLRALIARLPEARYRTRYVKVTDLSKRDLCREIARATCIEPAGSYPMLVDRLQERMSGLDRDDGLRSVLLLDEAQSIRREVLPLLAVLTNFEMDSRLVLSVILVGQKGLEHLLARDDMAAVRGRLAVKATLRPLSRDETHQYVEHRMALAGATTVPFDSAAIDALHETARGNLRALDHLARLSLDFAARRRIDTVDSGIVLAARKKIA
jgi:general secretion pathway protein A